MPERVKRVTRYDLLKPEIRESLTSEDAEVVVTDKLNSYLGPSGNLPLFQYQLRRLEALTAGWQSRDFWLQAYVLHVNSAERHSRRTFEVVTKLASGILSFMQEQGDTQKSVEQFDVEYVEKFIKWLGLRKVPKGGGVEKVQSPNTSRKYYDVVRTMFLEVHAESAAIWKLPLPSIFRNTPFPDAESATDHAEVLSDPVWEALYRGLRADAVETKRQIEEDWVVLTGPEIFPDPLKKGMGKYRSREVVLWEMKRHFSGAVLPSGADIRKFNASLGESITKYHGYESIANAFAPSVAAILPFVLLMGVYASPNTGPLRSILIPNVRQRHVMGVDRTVWDFNESLVKKAKEENDEIEGKPRIGFEFVKPRIHGSYVRSFLVDDNDALSPSSIFNFVANWTSAIRPFAEEYRNHLFIFAAQNRRVRGFHTATYGATDSDSSWGHAFSAFCNRHELPAMNMKEIRTTGLNRVNELFGGDLVPVRDAAGHARGSSTAEMSYMGYAARLKRDERLVEITSTMPREARHGGRSSVRGAPDTADAGAATPGWGCVDPYDSPVPGETPGALCGAFGQCPSCPHGTLDRTSPYSLVRNLQLREEIDRAHDYLTHTRWEAVFVPVRRALDEVWLPLFQDPKVISTARSLNLGPLGRLE